MPQTNQQKQRNVRQTSVGDVSGRQKGITMEVRGSCFLYITSRRLYVVTRAVSTRFGWFAVVLLFHTAETRDTLSYCRIFPLDSLNVHIHDVCVYFDINRHFT